ncbi:MAG: branched-chain amino acid transport system ATP-binding protein, partial [Haloarculaceae archaeon]
MAKADSTTETNEDAILELSDVTAGYDNTTVLHDINVAVEEGSIACLIGPNGSGKSTLMKSVYGFADVFDGQITFDGQDVTHRSPQNSLQSGMSYVLQSASVFSDMTVHENMIMGGYIFNDNERAESRTEELYDEFPILGDIRN